MPHTHVNIIPSNTGPRSDVWQGEPQAPRGLALCRRLKPRPISGKRHDLHRVGLAERYGMGTPRPGLRWGQPNGWPRPETAGAFWLSKREGPVEIRKDPVDIQEGSGRCPGFSTSIRKRRPFFELPTGEDVGAEHFITGD